MLRKLLFVIASAAGLLFAASESHAQKLPPVNSTLTNCVLGTQNQLSYYDATHLGCFPAPVNLSSVSGIDCTGVSDSTTAFQSTVTASKVVYIPRDCTIILNSVALPSSISIVGDGVTSVLKHKDSATGHMLTQSNTGAYTRLFNLKLDGNYLNNGGDSSPTKVLLRFQAGGTSDTVPAVGIVDSVTFVNGAYADVSYYEASAPTYPMYYYESNTFHYGGADSGFYGIFNQVKATMVNVVMDPGRLPTSATAVGKGGYAFFEATTSDTVKGSLTATNIQCYRTGTASPAGIIGCLDSYHGGDSVTISNSFSKSAVGRGFTAKADAQNIHFENLVVTDLVGNNNNPSILAVGQCVAINPGSVDVRSGYNGQLKNITCRNVGGAGIVVHGESGDNSQIGTNYDISGIVVDTCSDVLAAGVYALDLRSVNKARVSNVLITGCTNTVRLRQDLGSPTGPIILQNVQTISGSKPSIDSATKSALWMARNNIATAFSTSDLTLSVSANAVTAWNEVHFVDVSSANQTVSTINNVPLGQSVTIMANSSSNILTLTTGGNLGLTNTIAFKDTTSSVTFINVGGTLMPVVQQQNLQAFKTSSGGLKARPSDGTAANGNAVGLNALDLQTCSGSAATNTASGSNSVTLGCNNAATGNTAIALGNLNVADGSWGVQTGSRATARGRYAFNSHTGTRFSQNGDMQAGEQILGASTSSTSATRLTADLAAAGSANVVNLANNQSLSFEVVVDVYDTTTGDEVTYVGVTSTLQRCKIKRGANAASTAMIGTCTMTPLSTPGGSLTGLAAPTVTADTTNGGINVTFTNVTTNATHVVALVRTLEVQ